MPAPKSSNRNDAFNVLSETSGETIDWTKGKAKRAFLIVEVVPA